MNLKKNVPWGDHYNVQLRADSFNIFNHPNFATPNATISNSNVGTVTGISGTPSYEARTLEFAANSTSNLQTGNPFTQGSISPPELIRKLWRREGPA